MWIDQPRDDLQLEEIGLAPEVDPALERPPLTVRAQARAQPVTARSRRERDDTRAVGLHAEREQALAQVGFDRPEDAN